jgi:hypothetical protein
MQRNTGLLFGSKDFAAACYIQGTLINRARANAFFMRMPLENQLTDRYCTSTFSTLLPWRKLKT